jgi:hypothetical protein
MKKEVQLFAFEALECTRIPSALLANKFRAAIELTSLPESAPLLTLHTELAPPRMAVHGARKTT